MSPAPVERRARALPFLAFLFVVVGSCEMYCAVGELGTQGYLPIPTEGSPVAAEHLREVGRLTRDDPHRAALAIATVVAGAMLLLGGILLMRRRPSAIWWTKQALAANILATAAGGVSTFLHLNEIGGPVARELRAAMEADPTQQSGDVAQWMDFLWLQHGISRGLTIFVFAYFLWRITRPDVQAELAEGAP